MIIVKKSGYLKYKDLKFRCALGKAGIKKKTIVYSVRLVFDSIITFGKSKKEVFKCYCYLLKL